ncbi:MAG TPA: M48 family metalloprotease [Caulobacteraceae bacterium]|jgi:predicted Zn-dependent protease|nr:M48 family metalloprotease [Caulobacteraceae bacterium]
MTPRPADGREQARKLGVGLGASLGALAMAGALLAPVSAAFAQDAAAPIPLLSDTEMSEILHADADPIYTAAGLNPKSVKIFIVGDPTKEAMNSWVEGGQNMFVTAGLIIQTKTPNQLTGVFAHETGHMAGGHLARQDQGEKQTLATYLLTLGLGIAAAAAGAPDAAGGLLYSAGYFAALTGAGFTRTQESSADQAAVTYLERAGESAKGLVEFFDNFRYEEVFADARRYRFFMDHPLTSDRIDALQVRAEQQPHYNVVDSPEAIERHQILIAKLKGYLNLPQQTLDDYPESDTSFPAKYARAIAYSRDNDTDRAVALTDALIAERPTDPYLSQLKGQILFGAGRAKEAEAPLREAVRLKPDAPELLFLLGQTLLAEDSSAKLDEAIADLHHGLSLESDNPEGWLFLSQAYDKKGDGGMARLAAAEESFSLGQTDDARRFGMQARQLLSKGSPEWRRATDIVLTSKPSRDDLKLLAQQGGTNAPQKR